MPFYTLLCRSCGESFEKKATIAERTEKQIVCPACGSSNLDTDYSKGCAQVQVGSVSTRESSGCPHSSGCGCCGCGGAH